LTPVSKVGNGIEGVCRLFSFSYAPSADRLGMKLRVFAR
jgi:hypothetical protein